MIALRSWIRTEPGAEPLWAADGVCPLWIFVELAIWHGLMAGKNQLLVDRRFEGKSTRRRWGQNFKCSSPPLAFEPLSPPGDLVKVFGVAPWALTAAYPQYENSALMGVHPDAEERDPDRFFDVRSLPWGWGLRDPVPALEDQQ